MKTPVLLSFAALLFTACSATDVPETAASEAVIEQLAPKLSLMEAVISQMDRPATPQRDLTIGVRTEALNEILAAVSGNRSDDIRLRFLYSPRIVEERKTALGLPYTNFITIDSGSATINLRRMSLTTPKKNVLSMGLEADGSGKLAVTGKYTAITASASPVLRASLNDSVRFVFRRDSLNQLTFVPQRGFVNLRASVGIELLGWEVPYSKTIPLETKRIIPALNVPVSISSRVQMLVPNRTFGDKFVNETSPVSIEKLTTLIENGWIQIGMDITVVQ